MAMKYSTFMMPLHPPGRNVSETLQEDREAIILADPFVQQMMQDFGARIVPGSIKPATPAGPTPNSTN